MSIEDAKTQTINVRRLSRTTRFDGYTPRDGAPYVDIYRETLYRTDDGSIIGTPVVTAVRKSWDDIKGKSWTLASGQQLTALQIFEALATAFDDLTSPVPVTSLGDEAQP